MSATGPAPHDLLDELRRALAGHYEVERLLGQGGMGSVFLGRDPMLDRPVAIKVVSPELAASRAVRERFLQEARLVARLRHPHIVAALAAGEGEGVLYFVMEFVAGESLRGLIDRGAYGTPEGPGTVADGVRLVAELARALGYAHAHDVVHRDVKPENVLVDADGCAMLTDFGVARALSAGDARLTGTGFVVGSPRYMSPEQIAGEREIDGRSDVYSLGLVAYEMFAGEPAVGTTSGPTALMRQLTEIPAPLAERRPGVVPPPVSDAIARALAKDPAARWESADAFAAALDDALASLSTGGSRVSSSAFARATTSSAAAVPGGSVVPSRRRRRTAIGAGIALLAAIPLAWAGINGVRGADGPSEAERRRSYLVAPFEVQGGDQQGAWLREGSVSMLSLTLGQWADLRVVDYERVLDLVRDRGLDDKRVGLEDARALARDAGVWTVVTGQVSTVGDSLVVVARLYDVATGERLDQAQRGTLRGGDPRPVYDALARDLLRLAGAPAGVATATLAETTTPSVEAYRAYLAGSVALNRWKLAEADSLFAAAARADTGFALAYYRRALTLGWEKPGDSLQVELMNAALRHAGRLSPRDREFVGAYAELTRAFHAHFRLDTAAANRHMKAAQDGFQRVVARDSTSPEAWYALGDSYYHDANTDPQGRRRVANLTRSLRAFDRTIALDSTFYLAYSHQLDTYQQAGATAGPFMLEGDSVVLVTAELLRTLPPARVKAARDRARALAAAEARRWVETNPVPRAYAGLMQAHLAAERYDSAVAVIAEAQRRPEVRTLGGEFLLAQLQMRVDPAAASRTLRRALDSARVQPTRLRSMFGAPVVFEIMAGASAGAVAGRPADLDSAARIGVAAQGALPGAMGDVRTLAQWWITGQRLGLGLVTPQLLRNVDRGIAGVDEVKGPAAMYVRQQGIVVPYVAYLATREPRFLAATRRWRDTTQKWTELDALELVAKGDTAGAMRLARAWTRPDSLRAIGANTTGIRTIARAEVLAAAGDARGALAWYELLEPQKMAQLGYMDPIWALWPRTFLARGRLYEQVGDRAKAAASYARLLELWKDADPQLEPQRREAREGLARVRDAGAGTPVGVTR